MNYLDDYLNFITIEEGEDNLKKAEALRDQMGGVLYYSILSDDCNEIRRKLERMKRERQQASQAGK